MSIVNISYNAYSLQTTVNPAKTILSRNILARHVAEKILNTKDETVRDDFDFVDERYSSKIITVEGLLKSDTEDNLRILVDEVKNNLRPAEKNLDITYGAETRRFVGTLRTFETSEEHWHITEIPFRAEFLCHPFGKSTTPTTLNLNSGANITAGIHNETINILGTYKSKPVITFTISAENNLTSIKLENFTAQDWIQIVPAGGFGADTLIIDCENETVIRNAASQDFTGVFPLVLPGNNDIRITFTSTTHSVKVDILYYPNYL